MYSHQPVRHELYDDPKVRKSFYNLGTIMLEYFKFIIFQFILTIVLVVLLVVIVLNSISYSTSELNPELIIIGLGIFILVIVIMALFEYYYRYKMFKQIDYVAYQVQDEELKKAGKNLLLGFYLGILFQIIGILIVAWFIIDVIDMVNNSSNFDYYLSNFSNIQYLVIGISIVSYIPLILQVFGYIKLHKWAQRFMGSRTYTPYLNEIESGFEYMKFGAVLSIFIGIAYLAYVIGLKKASNGLMGEFGGNPQMSSRPAQYGNNFSRPMNTSYYRQPPQQGYYNNPNTQNYYPSYNNQPSSLNYQDDISFRGQNTSNIPEEELNSRTVMGPNPDFQNLVKTDKKASFCTECGKKIINSDAKFCQNCGNLIK